MRRRGKRTGCIERSSESTVSSGGPRRRGTTRHSGDRWPQIPLALGKPDGQCQGVDEHGWLGRESDGRLRRNRDGMVALAMRAAARMPRERPGIGRCLFGRRHQAMPNGARIDLPEIVLGTGSRGSQLQGKHQQHKRRQARGGAQVVKHRTGGRRGHRRRIHRLGGVMKLRGGPGRAICGR